jgi:hypothetical protein
VRIQKYTPSHLTPEIIQKIITLYGSGINITETLSSENIEIDANIIELIYDLQAGTYTRAALVNSDLINKRIEEIYSYISEHIDKSGIFLDAGVGEANTLVPLQEKMKLEKPILAFDISLSRVKWAQKNLSENNINSDLAVASLLSIPLSDNSVDFIFTSHALEPNGGNAIRILEEFNRITRKFIFLVEPDYENSGNQQKKRMDKLSYVKDLESSISKNGFELIQKIPLDVNSNENNRASLYIAKKRLENSLSNNQKWVDPYFKSNLILHEGCYSTKEGFLYPIIKGIPMLREKDSLYYLSPPSN